MRRSGLGYLRFLFFARGNKTKTGSTGGPLFRIIFFRCSLAFDLTLFCLSLFSHVIAPLISFQAGAYQFSALTLKRTSRLHRKMSAYGPKRTKQEDCHVPPVSIFVFDLGQSAFEFVGPRVYLTYRAARTFTDKPIRAF